MNEKFSVVQLADVPEPCHETARNPGPLTKAILATKGTGQAIRVELSGESPNNFRARIAGRRILSASGKVRTRHDGNGSMYVWLESR